jgi:UTP--glucose-1-phosphate uridylyltransferase
MRVAKAVITAAAPYQRTLPLHKLVDSDGEEKSVLRILVCHARAAGVDDIGVVVHPGDETVYADAVGDEARHLTFIPQASGGGYAGAVYCARDFAGKDPFLHVVGDHVYVSKSGSCARQIVALAEKEDCCVSAVQPTRETVIGQYGVVAGPRLTGRPDTYRVETVLEKPTPTEAEQKLVVTGMRAGSYLGFFGMHVLTPTVFSILGEVLNGGGRAMSLSAALAELARREQYLAVLSHGRRYDLGIPYGLLTAQIALALHGRDSSFVLSRILETVAARDMSAAE